MHENNKLRFSAITIVAIIIMWVIGAFHMYASNSGMANFTYHGFSLDSQENLYVGKSGRIDVYSKNGDHFKSITPRTSRVYYFTIIKDRIFLSTSSEAYILDLDGNVIQEREDRTGEIGRRLEPKGQIYVSSNGDEYKIIDSFTRFKIVKNDSAIIYQMPLLDCVLEWAFRISGVCFAVVMLWQLCQFKKDGILFGASSSENKN